MSTSAIDFETRGAIGAFEHERLEFGSNFRASFSQFVTSDVGHTTRQGHRLVRAGETPSVLHRFTKPISSARMRRVVRRETREPFEPTS